MVSQGTARRMASVLRNLYFTSFTQQWSSHLHELTDMTWQEVDNWFVVFHGVARAVAFKGSDRRFGRRNSGDLSEVLENIEPWLAMDAAAYVGWPRERGPQVLDHVRQRGH